MAMKKGYKALVDEALAEVITLTVEQAIKRRDEGDYVLVDIRDPRELEREGMVPGAFHAPRGMLEFWIDPESPYHKPLFAQDKTFVFFCAGGMRSALATKTAQDMGLPRVAHIGGGFKAWREAGGPVAARPPAPAPAPAAAPAPKRAAKPKANAKAKRKTKTKTKRK
jgi:rhodanese-related sulfurtransferase